MTTLHRRGAMFGRRDPSAGQRLVLRAIALLAVTAVAVALVSQHVFAMQPCPWCVLQRLAFVVLALVALLASFGAPALQRAGAALVALLAVIGVATGLWQRFVAERSASCDLTLADRVLHGLKLDVLLPSVFEPRANCADAAASLLGVPYPILAALLFATFGAAAVALLRRARG